MKISILCGAAAFAMLACSPATAQRAPDWRGNGGAGWDRDAFWRGAPAGPRERIDFVQRRIDRGIADGSLDRREARRAQYQLSSIRADAQRMRGRMTPEGRDMLLRRLDDLSRQVRWMRDNGRDAGGRGDYGRTDYAPPPPPVDDRRFATDYDASRYYRDGAQYQERRLSSQDEVYRGSDGRYYCKRNDGTTGLVIGAVGGGVLGNVIDGGHNRVAGTLIGGALGALAGKAIDQSNSDVRCR
jgi:hypothetical protein